MSRSLRMFAFLAMVCSIAVAQQDPNLEKGFSPGKAYQIGELDSVNLFNGNLIVTVPIGNRFPVNAGFSYGLTLTFNSKIWDYEDDWWDDSNENGGHSTSGLWRIPKPGSRANTGLGWLLSMGRLLSPHALSSDSWYWVYESPDGNDHAFYRRLRDGDPTSDTCIKPVDPCGVRQPVVSYTRSEPYLRLKHLEDGASEVHFPDGTIHRFEQDPAPGNEGVSRLVSISDPFGNFVGIEYTTSPAGLPQWEIVDSLARRHVVHFRTIPGQTQTNYQSVVDRIVFAGLGTYHFEYDDDAQIATACTTEPLPPNESLSVIVPILTHITLPDGSSFVVEQDSELAGCHSGTLKTLQVPTGAVTRWTYQPWVTPSSHCHSPHDHASGVLSKKVYASNTDTTPFAEWHYSLANSERIPPLAGTCYQPELPAPMIRYEYPYQEKVVTVTRPDGNKSRHYFSAWPVFGGGGAFSNREFGLPFTRFQSSVPVSGLPPRWLSTEMLDCSQPGCPVIRRTHLTYEIEPLSTPTDCGQGDCKSHHRRVVGSRETLEDGKWVDTAYSDFDGLGHYRKSETRSEETGKVKWSETNYNPGSTAKGRNPDPDGSLYFGTGEAWILGMFDREDVGDSAAEFTRRLSCFDPSTGFLKGRRSVARSDGVQSLVDQVVIFGNLIDPEEAETEGNVTSEEYFGGESIPLIVSGHCESETTPAFSKSHTYQYGVLKTSKFAGTNFFTVDRTIDARGLVVSERDTAGVQTDYAYDLMGRLIEVKPAGRAWTQYEYDPASSGGNAKINIYQWPNGASDSGTSLTRSEIIFDTLGRPSHHRRRLSPTGSAWSIRQTTYDAMGRQESVSEEELEAELPPSNFTLFTYDALGRPTSVTRPDQTETTWTYDGRENTRRDQIGTSLNGTTDVSTIERHDFLGRLVEVEQDSGSISAAYTYDWNDRLTGVVMNAPIPSNPANPEGSWTVGSQPRTFSYDALGLLRSEEHPETGVIEYEDYNALGLVGRKVHGGTFDQEFEYDDAGRLITVEVRNPNAPNEFRPGKEFVFGSGNATGNLKNGKLEKAIRHNLHPDLGGDVVVTETFTYGDSAGRITEKETSVVVHAGAPVAERVVQTFSQAFEYNDLDAPTVPGYPSCETFGCGAITSPPVGYGYTGDQLTSVTGFASAIIYQPNRLLSSVAHTNGVLYKQEPDPDGMARPRSISVENFDDCTAASINWEPVDVTISSGQTAFLSVGVAGDPPISYQWYEHGSSDVAIPGATSSSYTTPPLSVTMQYKARISNSCGAVAYSRTATVTVCDPPSISTQPSNETIQSGQSTRLTVSASGTGPFTYQWYQVTSPTTSEPVGSNASFYDTPPLTATTSYWVRVTNDCDEVDSATATVTIPLAAPTNLTATKGAGSSQIVVSWTASPGASRYAVERAAGAGFTTLNGNVSASPFTDSSGITGKTYIYRVRALDQNGASSSIPSNPDLASLVAFTQVAGLIDDAYFHQTLAGVNSVRAAMGWAPLGWSSILPAGVPPPAADVPLFAAYLEALRFRMNQALNGAGVPVPGYTDPVIQGGVTGIKAIYLIELQGRIQ